ASLQTLAFYPALWMPVFVHVPIVAHPRPPVGGVLRVAWGAWVVVAVGTLAAVLWAWVPGARIVSSWRAHRVAGANPAASPLRSTLVLEVLRVPRPWRFFEADLRALDDLGLEAATVALSADALRGSSELLDEIDRFVARNRAAGRKLVLWLQPPSSWYGGAWPPP